MQQPFVSWELRADLKDLGVEPGALLFVDPVTAAEHYSVAQGAAVGIPSSAPDLGGQMINHRRDLSNVTPLGRRGEGSGSGGRARW